MAKRKALAQKENVTRTDLKKALLEVAKDDVYSLAMQEIGSLARKPKKRRTEKRIADIEIIRRERRINERARKLAGEKRKIKLQKDRIAKMEKLQAKEAEEYIERLSVLIGEPLADKTQIELSPKPRLSEKQKKEVSVLKKVGLSEARKIVKSLHNGDLILSVPVLTSWVKLFPSKKASKNDKGKWEVVADHLLDFIKKRCKKEGRRLVCNTKTKFYGSRSK